jgi:hypothetical protein
MSATFDKDEAPAWYATVPNFPNIEVYSRGEHKGYVWLEYSGWPQDLIDAGIMMEHMLQPTGKHLRDADGDAVSLTRSWRLRDGLPQRHCKVRRAKPAAAMLALPGAREAIAARERYQAWQEAQHTPLTEESRQRLRLVVDNTRRDG